MTDTTVRPADAPADAPADRAATSIGPGVPVLAFDVGGTTIKAAYVDADGTPGAVLRTPSPAFGPSSAEAVVDAVADLAARLTPPGAEPRALGLTLPGIVDDETGFATYSENLGWRDVDFAALCRARIALPVAIGHDVRSGGTAEMELGAGRGHRTAVVVVLGTGVSAAVFVDGRPVVARGYAGEIGHAVVIPRGEACVCGNQGCLEAVSSAAAIARRYSRMSGREVAGAREVVEAMAAGDTIAAAVWDTAVEGLALGLSHVASLIQPEVVVLGGGLAEAGDHLFVPLRARLASLLTYVPVPPLVKARAGENAGLLGSALLARRAAGPGTDGSTDDRGEQHR
ncbi:ROK family protein [Cellulomonas sp. Y8]|uniref:ROK family protein n=1 Tax=Cellulomonas sp. Y8 TaxID=2591145 RepID=UPI003D7150C0